MRLWHNNRYVSLASCGGVKERECAARDRETLEKRSKLFINQNCMLELWIMRQFTIYNSIWYVCCLVVSLRWIVSRSLYSAYSDLSKLESQPNRDHILKYFCVCWKLGVRFVLSIWFWGMYMFCASIDKTKVIEYVIMSWREQLI